MRFRIRLTLITSSLLLLGTIICNNSSDCGVVNAFVFPSRTSIATTTTLRQRRQRQQQQCPKSNAAFSSLKSSSLLSSTSIDDIEETKKESTITQPQPPPTLTSSSTLTTTATQASIDETIRILLDVDNHPIGTLSDTVLNRFYPTLLELCKKQTNDSGSYTVDKLIKRIENEQDYYLNKSSNEDDDDERSGDDDQQQQMANHMKKLRCRYYCHAIEAWSLCTFVSKESAQRSEDYLSKIENTLLNEISNLSGMDYGESITSTQKIFKHIVVSYNTVIKTWRDHDSAKDAARVLQRLEDLSTKVKDKMKEELGGLYVDGDIIDSLKPDSISYTTVIDAYAKASDGSNKKENAINANTMFLRMKQSFEKGDVDCEPDIRSFNSLINAWVKVNDVPSVERAQDILFRMEQLYYEDEEDKEGEGEGGDNNNPNGSSSSDGGGNNKKVTTKNALYRIRPTVITYSTVMNGWSKSGSKDSFEKSKTVFDRMIKMYKHGNIEAKPNLFSYVALINSILCNLQTDRDAPSKADAIIRSMVEKEPLGDGVPIINDDTIIYPNVQILTKVIDSYGKVGGAGEKAEALLEWMIDLYKQTSDPNIRPNEITFNAVINAWAKSRSFGKAQHAFDILDRIDELNKQGIIDKNVKPNIIMATGVLNACAFTVGDTTEKNTALQIATDIFKNTILNNDNDGNGGEDDGNKKHKYLGELRPTHITYATMMSACKNLIPMHDARRSKIIQTVFKRCCMDGHVSSLVVTRLETASLLKVDMVSLLGDAFDEKSGKVHMNKLPTEWTQNTSNTRNNYYNNNNNRNANRRQQQRRR